MENIEFESLKKDEDNNLSKEIKKSKKWGRIRKTSLSLAVLGACAGVYGDLTETKKDDFLVPAGYTLSVVAAGVAGCSQKKKETVDEKLGKPSKFWKILKKVSFIGALVSLGATIATHLTEDKGDDKIIPWAAPLAILCGFLTGYAFQKNKDATKISKKEEASKNYREKILSPTTVLWDIKVPTSSDKTISQTLSSGSLSFNPKTIIKSTLPFLKATQKFHTKI